MIYLDKSSVIDEFFRSGTPQEIRDALRLITTALERTPIYFKGNQRTPPKKLMSGAESRITNKLKGLGNGVTAHFIHRDKPIKKSISSINSNDRVDILVVLGWNNSKYTVAIEFDAGRADQVSKKFVSRTSLLLGENLIYVAYCYPGRKCMNLAEVEKYFGYMNALSLSLNLVGFVGMAPPRNFHL